MQETTTLFDKNKCDMFEAYFGGEFSYKINHTTIDFTGLPGKSSKNGTDLITSSQRAQSLESGIKSLFFKDDHQTELDAIKRESDTLTVPLTLAIKISDDEEKTYKVYGQYYQNTCNFAKQNARKPKVA